MLIFVIAFVVLVVIFVSLLLKGLRDGQGFVVENYSFETEKKIDDFHFVFLSDLHEVQHGKCNSDLLKAIIECNPDCVLIGGDFLTGYKYIDNDFYDTLEFLRTLSEQFKIYYVPGNHERALWDVRDFARVTKNSEKKESDIDRINKLEQLFSDCGITLIRNDGIFLENVNVCIHGIDLDLEYYRRVIRKKPDVDYLKNAMGRCEDSCYNILMVHDPEHFPEYSKCGCDLVLSGHVHGGIVRVPGIGGVISPQLRLFPKYDSGVFSKNHTDMLISRGIGTHSVPIRLFNRAELCDVVVKCVNRS